MNKDKQDLSLKLEKACQANKEKKTFGSINNYNLAYNFKNRIYKDK